MRITLNNRLFAKSIQTTGKSLNQMRGISSVVTNRYNTRHWMADNTRTTLVSKRFAANSPQVDTELTEFLKNEIELEKKSQNQPLPAIPDWKITNDGSNVIFKKTFGNEEITVKANINHSVDAHNYGEDENEDVSPQMISRPEFAVEIKKGNQILGINCAFVDPEEMDDEPTAPDMKAEEKPAEDEFQINELSIYEEEFKDSSYVVSGEVMDGSMYDLLMDLLQERGIDQSFARSLIEYSTVYDHSQYVGLLETLKNFLAKK